MNLPLVSVVMSVRNVGAGIKETIRSIQLQENVFFEFIIVNDGSNDMTMDILRRIQESDPRIKLFDREPRGLTMSLIEACQLAKGEYIARQDAFDYSISGRLCAQASVLSSDRTASMVSSQVKFITQERETVFVPSANSTELSSNLTGVVHGSVMFRKSDYMRVGGYRPQFYYAQDVDLWSRLIEVGNHVHIPRILYENCLFPGSISGSRKKEQAKLHSLIIEATKARKFGNDESPWLERAAFFSEKCRLQKANKNDFAKGSYFIGACLAEKNSRLAKKYFEQTLNYNPLHLGARLKILTIK